MKCAMCCALPGDTRVSARRSGSYFPAQKRFSFLLRNGQEKRDTQGGVEDGGEGLGDTGGTHLDMCWTRQDACWTHPVGDARECWTHRGGGTWGTQRMHSVAFISAISSAHPARKHQGSPRVRLTLPTCTKGHQGHYSRLIMAFQNDQRRPPCTRANTKG